MKKLAIMLLLAVTLAGGAAANAQITPKDCLHLREYQRGKRAESIKSWVEVSNLLAKYDGKPFEIVIKGGNYNDKHSENWHFRDRDYYSLDEEGHHLLEGTFTPLKEDYDAAVKLLEKDGWKVQFKADDKAAQDAFDYCDSTYEENTKKLCSFHKWKREDAKQALDGLKYPNPADYDNSIMVVSE